MNSLYPNGNPACVGKINMCHSNINLLLEIFEGQLNLFKWSTEESTFLRFHSKTLQIAQVAILKPQQPCD